MRRFLVILVLSAMLSVTVWPHATFAGNASGASDPPPKPTSLPKPPDVIHFRIPVVFVFVLGSNPSDSAKISTELAKKLGTVLKDPVVPEAGWNSFADYAAQCEGDRAHTKGAFIVLPPAAGGTTKNYLVLVQKGTTVDFNAMISECDQMHEHKEPDVAWVSNTVAGEYSRSVIQFLPFAVLTSVYLAFAPQRTYQTTTSTVFPVPSPLPIGGARNSVQTLNSSVINGQGVGSVQNNIVSAVGLTNQNSNLYLGRQSDDAHLLIHAAEAAARDFLILFEAQCKQPQKSGDSFCTWRLDWKPLVAN
jgi:hypothetical protein